MRIGWEAEVDALFRVPLTEFVSARNALAARLQKTGQTTEAAAVKRMRRPTVPVWTINQIAHQDAEAVRQLVEAVDRLREAHFSGAGQIAQAREHQRAVLNGLLGRAKTVLTDAGIPTSPESLGRVSGALLGAAADPRQREALLRGRLTEESAAPGFEALTGDAPAMERSSPTDTSREARRPPPRARREDVARATEALRLAQTEARALSRQAEDLERTVTQRTAAADRAAKGVEDLRGQLAQAERRVSEARQTADEAMRAARRAREEAERAAARVQATEEALRRAGSV